MANRIRKIALFVAGTMLCSLCTGWGGVGGSQDARAQDSGRSSRSESESRDERRERYRRSSGDRGSDRGGDRSSDRRDWRGRSGDDSRRDERSSNSSSGSSGSSTKTSTPTSTSSTSKLTTSGTSSSMNMTEYAKSLVKQHDKNGDNMLQAEEQKDLRGRAAESDLNHDGVITIDELVAHLSTSTPATGASTTSTASTSSSSSTSGGDAGGHHHRDGDDKGRGDKADSDASKRVLTGSAGGMAAGTKEGDKRHSYRFTRADERLPSGLPGWFKD